MSDWLKNSSSLSWANKKKLTQHITRVEKNLSSAKESLLSLLAHVDKLKIDCKEFSELSGNNSRLTAKVILDLQPLLKCSEEFKDKLSTFCSNELKAFGCDDSENSSPTI